MSQVLPGDISLQRNIHRDKHYGRKEDKQKHTSNAAVKCRRNRCPIVLRKSKEMSQRISHTTKFKNGYKGGQ